MNVNITPNMQPFLNQPGCKNIINNKTCFKSMEGSCIDLILTSWPNLHQYTQVIEPGMSDYHVIVYTLFKSTYTKLEPKVLHKQEYKNFSRESFLIYLKFGLSNNDMVSIMSSNKYEIIMHLWNRKNFVGTQNHMSVKFWERNKWKDID